jgi:hypothetical protein
MIDDVKLMLNKSFSFVSRNACSEKEKEIKTNSGGKWNEKGSLSSYFSIYLIALKCE